MSLGDQRFGRLDNTAPVANNGATLALGWNALALLRSRLAQRRFARFLLTGSLNTGVGFGLFYAALAVCPTTLIALTASTILSVAFNFATMGTFVFGSRDLRRLFGFLTVNAIVFVYNAIGIALLQEIAVGPKVAAVLLLPGAVLASYTLNARFVFGRPR